MKMRNYLQKFFKDEEGQEGAEFLEYAVIIGLSAILVAVIVAIVFIVKRKALQAGEDIDEAGTDSTDVDWDAIQGDNDQDVNEALNALGNGGEE
jgi:Flp pilus assembly pilin Flp